MNQLAIMTGETEMQYLHPSRPSDQSSRTAVENEHSESKSEHLLQAILDELRHTGDAKPNPSLNKTATQDFGSSPHIPHPDVAAPKPCLPKLSQVMSNISSGSLHSPTDTGEAHFYQQLFTALVAFSIFGGSITFQAIFQAMPDSTQKTNVTPALARDYIAISWLLFTMDLSLSSIMLAALYVSRKTAGGDSQQREPWHKRIHRYLNLVAALILPLAAVAALIFTALAIQVISIAVGKTALVSVCVLGGVIVLWWFIFCTRQLHARRKKNQNPA